MGKHAQNYNYTLLLHLCSILTCWTHERWMNILTVSTGSSVHSVFCLFVFLSLHCGSIEPQVFFLYFLTHSDVGDYFTESCYEYIAKNLIWLRIHVFSLFYLNPCTRLHTSMENFKWPLMPKSENTKPCLFKLCSHINRLCMPGRYS